MEDEGGLSEEDKIRKKKFSKLPIAYSHLISCGQN
jgi:hypothetical protein